MSIATELTRIANAKTAIKTAINAKGGSLTNETIDQYAAAVNSITVGSGSGGSGSGIDVSDTTATNHDVLSGKYFYDSSGVKTEGSIIVVSSQPDPTVSVNTSTGLVTASYTAEAGFSEDNTTHSGTLQLNSSSVPTLLASNIKKDVAILGVTGTYEGSGGSTDFYKCVDINFGTCTESTTDVELVGTFTGKNDWGSSVDYSAYAGVYTLVDSTKTGTERQWSRTVGSTTYYIYYNSEVSKWTAYTNTTEYGMTCSDNSGPFGSWFDEMNYIDVSGFSRWAVILTPPAQKTWSGYKEVYRSGIRFYDTSTLYTNLTYDNDYPIPGRVYNADCTVEKPYKASTDPMSFYAKEAGTIVVTLQWSGTWRDTLKYRIGTTGDWLATTKDAVINVAQGQIIQFWNNSTICNTYETSGEFTHSDNFAIRFTSGKFEGGGSILSMVNYQNTGCFYRLMDNSLFGSQTTFPLVSAPDVPLTNLSKKCLYGLFADQEALLLPPELPFTGYAQDACRNMFSQCYSLTYLPEIHSLTDDMYGMFNGFFYDGRNGDYVKNLKFMNFNCTGWGSNYWCQYNYINRPYGIFFKTSLLPAKVCSVGSTYIYTPENWIIVDKA